MFWQSQRAALDKGLIVQINAPLRAHFGRCGPGAGGLFGSRAIPQAKPRTSETPNSPPAPGPHRGTKKRPCARWIRMTTCSESGQVRKEAAIRSLCRASESIECAGVFWCRGYPRVPAGRLVSRWSSASPAGSLDYQAPCRHPRVADQNRLKGHIYLIIESPALCRSLALPKHRLLRALGASDRCPYICNELLRISRVLRTIMNQIELR